MKMFRVLDDSAARHQAPGNTVTRILQLANELRVNGVKLNSESYEHMLSAYAKRGDVSRAYSLLKQMEGEGITPSREYCQKALQVCQSNAASDVMQWGSHTTIVGSKDRRYSGAGKDAACNGATWIPKDYKNISLHASLHATKLGIRESFGHVGHHGECKSKAGIAQLPVCD